MRTRKSTGRFGLVLLIIYSMILISCSQEKIPWQLDSEYSIYLTIRATDYRIMTGSDIYDTIDALRIYKVSQKHAEMFELSKLFKKQLVYETKDKQAIRKFMLATQDELVNISCQRKQDRPTFHVVAFDNTFMRAGYFLFNLCSKGDDEYGIIMPMHEAGSIYYTKSLLLMFKDLHLLKKSERHYGE